MDILFGGYNLTLLFCDFQRSFLGAFLAGYACCPFDSLIVFIIFWQFSLFPAFFLTLWNTQAYVFLDSFFFFIIFF